MTATIINSSREATQTAHDLAAYIVGAFAPHGLGTLKLQKLMYYAQGWHLGFLDVPIFEDRMEAWKHGPVLPGIYQSHKATSEVVEWPEGNASRIAGDTKRLVDTVLNTYRGKSGWALREQTHDEDPWVNAWAASNQGARRAQPISQDAIKEYFAAEVAKLRSNQVTSG